MDSNTQDCVNLAYNIDLYHLDTHPSEVKKIPEQDFEAELPHPEEKARRKIVGYDKAKDFAEEPYKVKKWAVPKIRDFRSSRLSDTAVVLKDSLKISQNVISVDIKTPDGKTTTLIASFFEGGIVKFNSVNPVNPSKFSVEMIDKPEGLVPYSVEGHVLKEDNRLSVDIEEVGIKVNIDFEPLRVLVLSNEDKEGTLLEFNANKTLLFDDNISGDFTFYSEYIYGLAERAHKCLLKDTSKELPYRIYNLDIGGYAPYCKVGLYGSCPIIISKSKNTQTFVSLYWQNASDTYVDIKKTENNSKTFWISERGNLEFYIFANRSVESHYKSFSAVFGNCAMPQYFSLGYHQSRYSYESQKDLLQVNSKLNEHKIPCDTLTLDIDHTLGRLYFTWNMDLYPDPVAMQEILKNDKRKLITISNPHLKTVDKYPIFREAFKKRLFIMNKDKQAFIGVCHPGDCIYLDYLNEDAQDFWAAQYSYGNYKFSTPILFAWNDMNEPTVFMSEDLEMRPDNIHTVKNNKDPKNVVHVEHREVHNVYSYCMNKATYMGMLRRNQDQNTRPHTLSRSWYAGSQKWTTIWTGDPLSSWQHLKISTSMFLSISLCGMSFCGGDLGGFIGDPAPELLVRWYQLGIFMPYFRAHSYIDFPRREPWLYDKKYLDMMREIVRERYKFLPYWYTIFEEHCRTNVPILRPTWLYEKESSDANMKDELRFMVGNSILAVPVCEEGQTVLTTPVKGLEGRWYDYYEKKEVLAEQDIDAPLEKTGFFIKGGSILPLFDIKEDIRSSQDARESELTLLVALDNENKAKGKAYFDDGETFDYKKGVFTRKDITYENGKLIWSKDGEGTYKVDNIVSKVVIMGAKDQLEKGFLHIKNQEKSDLQVTNADGYTVLEFKATVSEDWEIQLS